MKEKLSCTGGSQPGRNYCSLSFLKQIKHGQYISACQAVSHLPCTSPSFIPTHQISPSTTPNPHWHHHFNFTASGTWFWSKQLPHESLLFGCDALPRQQLSSGWLLNVPFGLFLFVCFPSARLQSGGQTKAEPVNVTKHSYVNVMKQDLLFPLASKLDFSRELLQPSTQQPPKAPAPGGPPMLPLFHWWGVKQSFLHKWAVQHLSWSHAPSLFQRGFPGREVLQCPKTQTTWALTSRPARTCISLTRTCLLHLSGVLCLNGTGSNSSNAPNRLPVQIGQQEREGSITARAGWHSSCRESWQKASSFLPAAGIAREQRKAKHPHARPARQALRSSYGLYPLLWSSIAASRKGHNESQEWKKATAKMSNEYSGFATGWQQQHCPALVLWWLGVRIPTVRPSPPCLASVQLPA